MRHRLAAILIPTALALAGMVMIALWIGVGPLRRVQARLPGLDKVPRGRAAENSHSSRPRRAGPLWRPGVSAHHVLPGPGFRGTDLRRGAINKENVRLARHWPSGGPKSGSGQPSWARATQQQP